MSANKLLLTVDVEDWFQAENITKVISRDKWEAQQLRIEKNVNLILELFSNTNVKATFFCLGWIAERAPQVIKKIADAGHEIASHGYMHNLIYNQTPVAFREDVKKAKTLLQDITGKEVKGYRAPTFSMTDWALPILLEEGYRYDSSIVITSLHDRYGKVTIPAGKIAGDCFEIRPGLFEFSLPCLQVQGKSVPWGGGGYFRLFPYPLYRWGFNKILQNKNFVFYMHPWEVDPGQPRVEGIARFNKFRHYVNLDKTAGKLKKLIEENKSNCITLSEFIVSI